MKLLTLTTALTLILSINWSTQMANASMETKEKKTTLPHWNAELYKKNSLKLQQATALSVIEDVNFRKGDKAIWDVGCGDGKITKVIAEKNKNGFILGTDLSADMIDLAQEFSGNNLKFAVGNAEDYAPNQKFDIIFSFFCLQWVKDKQKAFRNIANHLNPNGEVYLIMTDRNPALKKVRQRMFKSPEWNQYYKDYVDPTDVIDMDQYPDYAKNANLSDVKFQTYDKVVHFDSYEELHAFIRMVTPPINLLPSEELKSKFVDELVKGYVAEVEEIEGSKNYIKYNIKYLRAKV